jgi:tRNA nucleotidyltransferase (CCA-adding enzyme)
VIGPPVSKHPYGHLKGNAFDISGAGIDVNEIAEIVRKVSESKVPVKLSAKPEPENRAVHVSVISASYDPNLIAQIFSVNSRIASEDWDFIKLAYEDLLLSSPPEEIVAEFEDVFGLKKTAGKFEEEKDDPKWNEVLLDKEGTKLTRRQIRSHYLKYKSKIMSEIKDKPIMIFIQTAKNKNVLKRNHGGKKIVITNDDPSKANSPSNYQYWVDRRLIGIHRVLEAQTKIGFVDLDLHGGYSREQALKYARKISAEIKKEFGVSTTIYDSGGTGFHIEFRLKEAQPTDALRNKLRSMCDELNKDFEGATSGIVKGRGMRTDTTTLKKAGNLRVPYTLNENTGRMKKPAEGSKKALSAHTIKTADVGISSPYSDGFVPPSLTEEAKEIAQNSPDVFLSDYISQYPQFRRLAVKSMALQNPMSYFVIFKLHNDPENSPISKLALYSLLATRPDIYFSQELYANEDFKEFHRLAAYYTANLRPEFFLDVLLKIMPEHEEFRDTAERNLKKVKKSAGVLEYPPKLYESIVLWLDEVIEDMTDEWLADMKPPKIKCKEFDIDFSGTKIYDRYSKDIEMLQASEIYDNISICVEPRRSSTIDAIYEDNYGQPQIVLFGLPQYLLEAASPKHSKYYLEEAHTTLKHELTHLPQYILETIVGVKKGPEAERGVGLPHYYDPARARAYETETLSGVVPEEYLRSDVEFFPLINNLIHWLGQILKLEWVVNEKEAEFLKKNMPDMIDEYGKINLGAFNREQKERLMKHRFSSFISDNEYIQSLRDNPVRYNKLVRELYRIFDQKMLKGASISKRAGLYGGWISPQGEFYEVGLYGHAGFVFNNPEIFDDFEEAGAKTVGRYMASKGWIRAVVEVGRLSFDLPQLEDKYIQRIQNILPLFPPKRYVELWWSGADETLLVPYSAFVASYGVLDLRRVRVASISKRAQPEIKLDAQEEKIFGLLNEVVEYYGLPVELYVAGGWLRDAILEQMSNKDIDVVIDGDLSGREMAEYVVKYLREVKGQEQKDATVISQNVEKSKHLETATINIWGQDIDFAQTRTEVYDDKSRVPEVKSATIEEDIFRRDLTINSLLYSIRTGEIKDFTGKGLEDLKNGIIRTPIDPEKTFMDDPLRILRAIRFSSKYGFQLDPELTDAVKNPDIQKALSEKVSRERIAIEVRKMLSGPNPVKAMELIKELGLRSEVFHLPETYEDWDMSQNSPHHQFNVWDHTLQVLSNLQEIIKDRNISDADKFVLNLASLMHDVSKLDPQIKGTKELEGKIINTYHGHEVESMKAAEYVLRNLPGIRNEEIDRVKKLIDAARRINPQRCPTDQTCEMARKTLGKFVRAIGDDWEMGIDLGMADTAGHFARQLETHPRTYYETMKEQIRTMDPERTQKMRPLLDGNELMAMFNRKGGSWINALMKEMVDWQFEDPSATKQDAVEFAKKTYQERGLDNKVSYFPATKHSDGCKVAKMKILSPELHKLHKNLKKALKDAGVEMADSFPTYNPHTTLEYMPPPKEKWDDDVPSGSWTVKSVELWGCGKNKTIDFKKPLSKRSKQLLPGGLGDKLKPEDVDPKELEMGIKVEMEHTDNKELAKEVALDHLSEMKDYYSKLEKMEKGECD